MSSCTAADGASSSGHGASITTARSEARRSARRCASASVSSRRLSHSTETTGGPRAGKSASWASVRTTGSLGSTTFSGLEASCSRSASIPARTSAPGPTRAGEPAPISASTLRMGCCRKGRVAARSTISSHSCDRCSMLRAKPSPC
ncbi:Uncharacterised protein [Mycobacteroides abscessus subsp. abscessus]|nr:Uncharacterised protein [Mycobacteroides abscessus subsp. abscessus]